MSIILKRLTMAAIIGFCMFFSIAIFFRHEAPIVDQQIVEKAERCSGLDQVEAVEKEIDGDSTAKPSTTPTLEASTEPSVEPSYSKEDVKWLYKLVEAENGILDYHGKYLTACCVLNRVSSMDFKGDSIYDVIFCPGQFDVVTEGTIYDVIPSKETKKACDDALANNTAPWCVGFSAGDLHSGWLELVEWDGNTAFYKERGRVY